MHTEVAAALKGATFFSVKEHSLPKGGEKTTS